MPVYRFHTLKEASAALWSSPDDPKLPGRIRGWWRTCARFSRTHCPRRLRKCGSIEAANAEQRAWRVETFRKPAEKPPPT